ncbi:MAG: HD domain-containing protein [Desulfarculales bacterium]|jgi:putative hydrolase of HD superfamily|nr:HD domain-containing protein [Desulfarculales bacterium]
MKGLALLAFEAGMLKKLRRTGYPFLGSGGESVADHSFRAALLGYHLALTQPGADAARVALMLLHHDLPESRTNDLNYVHKQYVQADENKAGAHQAANLPSRNRDVFLGLLEEFNAQESLEAQLARDADQLDMIVELKEQQDLGNAYARQWLEYVPKRLLTPAARELAQEILNTDWTEWWFAKRDDWWVPDKKNT